MNEELNQRFEKRVKLDDQILYKISKIDECKLAWKFSTSMHPQLLGSLKQSVIITSTGSSTRIEGSSMTDQDVARFLKENKLPKPKNRDEEEVAGYADLISRVFNNYDSMTFSEGYILQFHSILLQFSQKDILHKGQYKKKENLVVAIDAKGKQTKIFEPTPAWLTKTEMDNMFSWFLESKRDGKTHPLIRIANAIFEFLAIHPFEDGNGRISRALTNMLMLQDGYSYVPYVSLDQIIENNKDDYYVSLRKTQAHHKTDDEDITSWLNFFLDSVLSHAQIAVEISSLQHPILLLSEKQKSIYDLFSTHVNLSPKEIYEYLPHIAMITIRESLAKMVGLKLLMRTGQGSAVRYMRVG